MAQDNHRCRNCHKRPARTHYSELSTSMVCWDCYRRLTTVQAPRRKNAAHTDPFAIFDEPKR